MGKGKGSKKEREIFVNSDCLSSHSQQLFLSLSLSLSPPRKLILSLSLSLSLSLPLRECAPVPAAGAEREKGRKTLPVERGSKTSSPMGTGMSARSTSVGVRVMSWSMNWPQYVCRSDTDRGFHGRDGGEEKSALLTARAERDDVASELPSSPYDRIAG